MSSFHRTSSPILTMSMSPPSAHQLPLDRPYSSYHPSSAFSHPPPVASWSAFGQRSGPSTAPRGHKRSRDEAAANLDPPEKLMQPVIEPVEEKEDEWEYGPGMVLVKKGSCYVRDASNQTGTWLEERAAAMDAIRREEALKEQQRQAQERPSLRSHKSSRLDLSSASQQDSNHVNGTAANYSNGGSPTRDRNGDGAAPALSPSDTACQPIVDDFTRHLGIGWSRLSESEHIQAAARGWGRYIENHYPVTDPKILLESKGLESYLVEAREGFFLFTENLRQGRLVSSDPQRALNNLKSSPPVFDGAHILAAANSPRLASIDAPPPAAAATVAAATTMPFSAGSNGPIPVPVVSTATGVAASAIPTLKHPSIMHTSTVTAVDIDVDMI